MTVRADDADAQQTTARILQDASGRRSRRGRKLFSRCSPSRRKRRQMYASSRRHSTPTQLQFAHKLPPAGQQQALPFSDALEDFLHEISSGTDACGSALLETARREIGSRNPACHQRRLIKGPITHMSSSQLGLHHSPSRLPRYLRPCLADCRSGFAARYTLDYASPACSQPHRLPS